MATMTLAGQRRSRQPRARQPDGAHRRPDMVGMSYGELTNDSGDAGERGAARHPGASARRDPARARRPTGLWTTGWSARPWLRCATPRAVRSTSSSRSRTSPASGPLSRSCGTARNDSGCWSRPSRTTRSSCSTRRATSPAGTRAPSASRATRPTRSSASTSARSTRRSCRTSATPSTSCELALRDGHYEEEGWRVRKDGTQFWANVVITAVLDSDGRARRLRQGHPRQQRATPSRAGPGGGRARAGRGERRAGRPERAAAAGRRRPGAVPGRHCARAAHAGQRAGRGGRDCWASTGRPRQRRSGRSCWARMGSSTTRLRRLLADLLTASRLQSSALELARRRRSVAEIVNGAVTTVRRSHDRRRDRRGGHVRTPWCDGDGDRLAQAVDNLLINALRHGAPARCARSRVGRTTTSRSG